MHGVFPSSGGHPASSPEPQVRRASCYDSRRIVTPFVQVGTYPTRNFATLGPLLLRPPFTGASIQSFALRLTPPFNLPAPGRRQPLYVVFMTLQRPVFLLNSRPALFSAAHVLGGHPFSRSYGVNVPSSLTTYHPSALEYSSRPPVSVYGTDSLGS